METMQTYCYHVIKFLIAPDSLVHGDYCIPESWIVRKDNNSSIVLLAYPNEPWQITMNRIKNYENISDDWDLYLAEIRYSTNFYDSVICLINEHQDRVFACRSPAGIAMKPLLSTDSSISSSTVLSCRTNAISTSFSVFDRSFGKFHSFLNRWYSTMLMMSGSMVPALTILGKIMDPFNLYNNSTNNDVYLSTPQNLSNRRKRQKKNLNDNYDNVFLNSRHTDSRWTLKHRKWSPGLTVLMPNSCIYIDKMQLENCKKFSRKCTHLARLLMKHIFTGYALKTCSLTERKLAGRSRLKLNQDGITAIVGFVLEYGASKNWVPSSVVSIKNAMRYQLKLSE